MTDVVFLPGLNNDALVWAPTLAALHPRLTGRAIDLPAEPDLAALAEQVAAQLTEGTVLVGHSFGGVVAMTVAEKHPELLRGLVLVNAPIDVESAEQATARIERVSGLDEESFEAAAMGRLDVVFAPERANDDAVKAERVRGLRAYGVERYKAHCTAITQRVDRANFLSETELPVLVIAADDDVVVPTSAQRDWANAGGASYVEVAGTRHMLPAEEPEQVATAINDWWRTTEAGRGYVALSLPDATLPDYVVHGVGDTTLFLMHGAYGNRDYFDDAISRWNAAGFRVVAWSCPGYGAEEVPDGYGVPLLAEYCARMILAERTEHNVLLGHSMGGLIGPRVPALVGDALDGVILSGASAGFVNRTADDKARYLRERVKPIAEDGLTVAEYAVGLLKVMMAPRAQGPLVDRVVEVVNGMKTEVFLASMRAITEYNSVPSLTSLKVPALMLAGESDTACPPAGMQKMQEMTPGSSFHQINNAGHYAFAEQADEYHEVTTDFIRRVVGAGQPS
ncbi:alpha/beta fold hydrolase [Paeniglutamicibacter sp. MACA_103]|uniref:alpha/beta fold hydrolase n=1 Tax=Paeniglutamicibacter sp. MACA_103 TaxID=3377337 RepID=UPI003894E513